ncbi:MAG TPA: rhomboid family intramembrane serine protease, partial [Leptospiraceae bacterium]|nr:rhomboid family intramembrane serine protease [Leptospiraceae bacterium]
MIKILIIINAAVFIMQLVTGFLNFPFINVFFSLNPDKVTNFHIYQLVSYSFLHANFMHLVLNMLALWMFGAELEEYWGKKNILIFYLFTAFTGGLLTWAVHFFHPQGIVVGASGAVFGIMCAYAL